MLAYVSRQRNTFMRKHPKPALHELQRQSFRSLYEQIADRLRDDIVATGAGGQLPTEEALMLRYGVSRSTVRKAVQRLVDESILYRRQGKGTFVARPLPHIVHSLDEIAPFYDTFRRAGEDFTAEILDFQWSETIDLPDVLKGWQRPVLTYQRRYVSRGVPHAIAQVSLPLDIGRKIARADLEASPIYGVLRGKLGITFGSVDYIVSSRQPPADVSTALEISQSSSLLVMDRVTRDVEGRAVESTRHFLRPDVYQLSVHLDNLRKS